MKVHNTIIKNIIYECFFILLLEPIMAIIKLINKRIPKNTEPTVNNETNPFAGLSE